MGRAKHADSQRDKIFYALVNILLVGAIAAVLYPLVYVVSSSFSSPSAVMSGKVWLYPVELSLEGYKAVFRHKFILSGFANSTFYAAVGTLVNVGITTLAAYPLSRKDLRPRGAIMLVFAFTMFFTGGIIPTYLLVNSLGLINTRAAMILPTALSVWNLIIMRTFFESSIPDELLDSGRIDGCNDVRFLVSIVLPLSTAVIAVTALFYAVFNWNSYFNALIYLSRRELYPLQLVLREVLIINDVNAATLDNLEALIARQGLQGLLKYSLIVVASLPVLVLYPFAQRYFVKGVMVGAIKG